MPTDRTKIEAADLTVLTRVTDRGVFVDLLDRGCRFSRLYFEDTTIAQKVLASALEQLLAPPVAPLPVTPAPWFILEVEGRRFLAAKTTPDHPYHNRTRCPLLNPGQHLQLERWTDNYHTKLFVLRWAGEDVEYSILEPFGYTDEIPWD